MTEHDMKLLINAQALKRVSIHYGVMSQGYMVIADGRVLETSKGETREFKTLDTAAKLLFKMGIADFSVKLKTSV
jgi:hypothetical protein